MARSLATLAGTGDFWRAAAATLLRILAGFGVGAVLGTALGAATAASRWGADRLFSPALRAVRTVPVVSFILLLYFSPSYGPGSGGGGRPHGAAGGLAFRPAGHCRRRSPFAGAGGEPIVSAGPRPFAWSIFPPRLLR